MSSFRACVRLLNLACVLLLGQSLALAGQAGVANLRVTVLDPSGAVVVASQVQVKDGTGRLKKIETNGQGEAIFSGLAPGSCELRVEATGFMPRDVDGVALKPGGNQVEVRLEIAGLKEEVLVEQNKQEGRTDSRGDAFTNILTEEQVANLPDDPDELEATLKSMAGPGAVIRVNGFSGGKLPPKSQIRQIRFRQNSFAAEYHEAGFIGIDVLTKPGVNGWHGSLSLALRDEALNARNAFSTTRGPEQLRRFGLSMDGPLWRDRTSLFLSADSNQSFDSQTVVAALPGGSFFDLIRRPSRAFYGSARVVHAWLGTHTLSAEYQHNSNRRDNIGAGNFDLPERAYSLGLDENILRVSDVGTLGKRLFNELRFQARWRGTVKKPVSDAPAIIVLNAFNRGGAAAATDDGASTFEIADNVDFAFGRHAMRAGVLFEAGAYSSDTVFNPGGTFTFASLDDFRASRPTTFVQKIGRRPFEFSHYQFGAYWQDDVRLRPNLTLSFGVRYEGQNNIDDRNNLAPRFGLAWSPFKDGRTTVRGGFGIFYVWFGASTTADILGLDGREQFDLVIRDPGFPDPFEGGSQLILPPGRLQRDPASVNPQIRQASLSVERQIGRGLFMRTSYLNQQGVNLLRGRDVNAPLPGGGRPDPEAGTVTQVESKARSSYHMLNLGLNSLVSKRLYWFIDYSLSKSVNEADGAFSLPADNLDLRAERGPSSDDSRHRFFANLGLGLFKGLRLATTFHANSALPYNITTGRDNNGDTVFNDRPEGVSRNSARGAAYWDVSARLSWIIGFGESRGAGQGQGSRTVRVSSSDVGSIASELAALEKRWRISLYIQAFNVFNHANPVNFTGVQTSPFFGQATAALPGRRIETGMRFSF